MWLIQRDKMPEQDLYMVLNKQGQKLTDVIMYDGEAPQTVFTDNSPALLTKQELKDVLGELPLKQVQDMSIAKVQLVVRDYVELNTL